MLRASSIVPRGMAPTLLIRISVSGHWSASVSTVLAAGRIKREAAHCNIVLAGDAHSGGFEIGRRARDQHDPNSARTSAQARPIPRDAPVISASRPRNASSIRCLSAKLPSSPQMRKSRDPRISFWRGTGVSYATLF